MSATNESVFNSFKQFLQTYDCGKSGLNLKPSPDAERKDLSVNASNLETVVLRSRQSSDSCLFADHTISPSDVEPEVFDWIFYHLDYKKCPYPLAFALSSKVSHRLGLAETIRESQSPDADKSKPALSSNDLYSQSLEYLTEYINSWKENPEIAVEIAKEYSEQTFVTSICAIKNTRRKMEDRHVILHDLNKALGLNVQKQYSYYAIFDGHAGVDAASYSSSHLHHSLVKSQAFLDGDIVGAFKEAFSLTDLHYLERSLRENRKSGSTALCALLENRSKLYIAWLGDSQAVLVRNGKPIDIMIPHKPELEEERKRIEELGGFVAYVDTWRVNGTLAVSRAIGDPEHKPYISSEPDVVELDINSEADFLILACDGLWDQLTPEEATTLVYQYICENEDQNTQQIAENVSLHLSKAAKDDGSSDNITTIVLFFKDMAELKATPFEPLTPREKSDINGLNGNHFEYNDIDFMQSNANNPFDSRDDMSWGTGFDVMNNAKLNFEITDSFNNSDNSRNDSKQTTNPFDLNNPNKPLDNNQLNNESLSRERLNSFEGNDRLDSDLQSITNNSNNDSEFNISKLSDISASFPIQGVIQSDHALCSTPIQTSDPFSINSVSQENIVLETNMDSNNVFQELNQSSGAEPDSMPESEQQKDFVDYSKESFTSAQFDFDNSSSFEKSGYQTAYEQNIADNLNASNDETPVQTPIKLGDVCEQVFNDTEETNESFNENQDIHDFDSDAESVDSFCYEKIGSDLSQITKRFENDLCLQQNDFSFKPESDQRIDSEDVKKSNELAENEDILISEQKSPEKAQIDQQMVAEEVWIDSEPEETIVPQISLDSIKVDKTPEEVQESQQLISELNIESTKEEPIEPQINFEALKSDLMAEHMTPEEAQAVAQQLTGEEPEQSVEPQFEDLIHPLVDPTHEVPEQPIEPQISFEDLNSNSLIPEEDHQLIDEQNVSNLIENELSLKPESDQRIDFKELKGVLKSDELIPIDTNAVFGNQTSEEAQVVHQLVPEISFENLNLIEVEKTPEEVHEVISELNVDLSPNESEKYEEMKPQINFNAFESDLISELILPEVVPQQVIETLTSEQNGDSIHKEPEESIEPQIELKSQKISSNESQKESQISSKTTKPLPKSDPKSKPLVTTKAPAKGTVSPSSKLVSKAPTKGTAAVSASTKATAKVASTASRVTAKSASTVASKPSTAPANRPIKTTKPIAEKTGPKPLTATTRPKTTTTTSSRPTAGIGSSSAPKPTSRPIESRVTSSSRLTSTATRPTTTTSRAPITKPLESKTTAKSAPTRAPIASRTATTGLSANSSSTLRTLTGRPNTSSVTSSGAQTKSTLSSNITRKTTTASKPIQSSVNGVKPVVNGVKQSTTRPATTIGAKSATSRVNTVRVGSSVSAKPTATSTKTTTSSLQTKTGLKPTSIKGENKPTAVPKGNGTRIAPKTNDISHSSVTTTTSSVVKNNNPLKVTNSLKQELEDADLKYQPVLESHRNDIFTPDSDTNYSSPNTLEKAFILSNSESLNLDSSPDVNGNNN